MIERFNITYKELLYSILQKNFIGKHHLRIRSYLIRYKYTDSVSNTRWGKT